MSDKVLPLRDAEGVERFLDLISSDEGGGEFGPDGITITERERIVLGHWLPGYGGVLGGVQPNGSNDDVNGEIEHQDDPPNLILPVRGWESPRNRLLRAASSTFTTAQTMGNVGYFPFTSPRWAKGALFMVNLATVPGGGQTISLKVNAVYSKTAGPPYTAGVDYVDFGSLGAAAGIFMCLLHPTYTAGDLAAGVAVKKAAPLPGRWECVLTPSGAGTWGIDLDVQLLS